MATPDYTVTPQGAAFGDPTRQRAGIVRNNEHPARARRGRGIAFVDIFDISSRAAVDRTLVARDGLHPSGIQYGLWVDRIEPVVRGLLRDSFGTASPRSAATLWVRVSRLVAPTADRPLSPKHEVRARHVARPTGSPIHAQPGRQCPAVKRGALA